MRIQVLGSKRNQKIGCWYCAQASDSGRSTARHHSCLVQLRNNLHWKRMHLLVPVHAMDGLSGTHISQAITSLDMFCEEISMQDSCWCRGLAMLIFLTLAGQSCPERSDPEDFLLLTLLSLHNLLQRRLNASVLVQSDQQHWKFDNARGLPQVLLLRVLLNSCCFCLSFCLAQMSKMNRQAFEGIVLTARFWVLAPD